jgi:hypothetical protein
VIVRRDPMWPPVPKNKLAALHYPAARFFDIASEFERRDASSHPPARWYVIQQFDRADDVERLLGDRKPRLIVTDPHYCISLDSEWSGVKTVTEPQTKVSS